MSEMIHDGRHSEVEINVDRLKILEGSQGGVELLLWWWGLMGAARGVCLCGLVHSFVEPIG